MGAGSMTAAAMLLRRKTIGLLDALHAGTGVPGARAAHRSYRTPGAVRAVRAMRCAGVCGGAPAHTAPPPPLQPGPNSPSAHACSRPHLAASLHAGGSDVEEAATCARGGAVVACVRWCAAGGRAVGVWEAGAAGPAGRRATGTRNSPPPVFLPSAGRLLAAPGRRRRSTRPRSPTPSLLGRARSGRPSPLPAAAACLPQLLLRLGSARRVVHPDMQRKVRDCAMLGEVCPQPSHSIAHARHRVQWGVSGSRQHSKLTRRRQTSRKVLPSCTALRCSPPRGCSPTPHAGEAEEGAAAAAAAVAGMSACMPSPPPGARRKAAARRAAAAAGWSWTERACTRMGPTCRAGSSQAVWS